MKNQKFIQKLINSGIFVIILAVPVSFVLKVVRGGTIYLETKIPIVDVIIWLVFLFWGFKILTSKELRKVKLPPSPFVAYFIVAVLSLVNSTNLLDSSKEIIQIIGYFFFGYILFVNNIVTYGQLKKIIYFLSGITILVVTYGIYQSMVLSGSSYLISSTFDNRNVLGGYLAIVLPIFFGLVLSNLSIRSLVWFGSIILGGLAVTTSAPSFFSLLVAFVFVSLLCDKTPIKRCWLVSGVIAIFVIFVILPIGVHLSDFKEARTLLYEPKGLEQYRVKVMRSIEMSYIEDIAKGKLGLYDLYLSSNITTPKVIPDSYVRHTLNAKKKDIMFGNSGHINQRFLEWQAALNVLTDKPLLGTGIGNYQREIGYYYRFLPKLNTMEPDSQNGYLIIAFTMGLAGLGAFLWIIFHFLGLLVDIFPNAKNRFLHGLSIGLSGSLTAFCINNFFSPLLYNATAMVFVFILSLISLLNQRMMQLNYKKNEP